MKVLVVWEEIPENTSLYMIEDPTDEQLEVLKAVHMKFINCDDDEELVFLNDALCSDSSCYSGEVPPEWEGIWGDCKIPSDEPVEGPIDLVVVTGFYL